jgi:hypothetical protein
MNIYSGLIKQERDYNEFNLIYSGLFAANFNKNYTVFVILIKKR